MRIQTSTPEAGYFWLPTEPNKRVPGMLRLVDGGEIELEIFGTFGDGTDLLGGMYMPRVLGVIEKALVTLEHCTYINKKISFGGVARSPLSVRRALYGYHFDQDEAVMLDSLAVSVEGLHDWLGISGLQVNHNFDQRITTMTFVPPEDQVFRVRDGLDARITTTWRTSGHGDVRLREATIAQRPYIELRSDKPISIDSFTKFGKQLTAFLCFATDKTVAIDQLFGSPHVEHLRSEGKPPKMEIVYQSIPFAERAPKIDVRRMLFHFDEIEGRFGDVLGRWFTAYQSFQPTLDLLLHSSTQRFINWRFLSLVQAAENYHRRTSDEAYASADDYNVLSDELMAACRQEHREWLSKKLEFGNEISLAKRIKRLIAPFESYFGDRDAVKQLAHRIAKMRNYYTHFTSNVTRDEDHGIELLDLSTKIEVILQLHLLKELGFSKEEIDVLVQKSEQIAWKLGPKREA